MKHSGNGASPTHCDTAQIEALMAAYQANRDLASLSAIVDLVQRRPLTLIRFHRTTRYLPEDELLSDVNLKLLKAVDRFDPARGTAFTYSSATIQNTLRTAVSHARVVRKRCVRLSRAVTNQLHTNGEIDSRDAIEDLAHRIKAGSRPP